MALRRIAQRDRSPARFAAIYGSTMMPMRLSDDPEEAIRALLKVDPEADPDLGDADVRKIVRGAVSDPQVDDEGEA
jgi:hypothetical protein